MRFKGTFALLLICAGFGAYLYFYEMKSGTDSDAAKQEQSRIWKVDANSVQQIDIVSPEGQITAVRAGEKDWKITVPRPLEADSDEVNRLVTSASDLSRESLLESNAANLATFGLQPPRTTVELKTKDGKQYKILFGINNPTGNSTYATVPGKNEVLLVANYTATSFNKKLDDVRNRSILAFEQSEVQSADLETSKGKVQLVKENDKWAIQGKEKWPADSSAVTSILSDLSAGKVKEFFDGDPSDYVTLGFDKPSAEIRVVVGKSRAVKHLTVGIEKSRLLKKGEKPKPEPKKTETAEKKDEKPADSSVLFLARDETRPELFFVEKEFVDKLLKTPEDLRDKALASYPRWDIDTIVLTNSKGTFTFTKSGSGGDWVLGDAKKKTKWDAVNGILDALEKPVKNFIDSPESPAAYGLEKPAVEVVLKQGGTVRADCAFGKEAKDGVYAQVKGEKSVKVADKDSLEKLNKGESDFVEPPPAPATAPAKK
jgi:hypothetical protein